LTSGEVQTIGCTVLHADQAQKNLGPLTDTVTHVVLDRALPACADIRTVMVYELTGDYLLFWDGAYDTTITSGAVYLPGIMVEDESGPGVEVGRTISQNGYVPGVVIHLQDIEVGRKVLLVDATKLPVKATVHSAPVIAPAFSSVNSFVHLVLTLDADSV